MRPTLSGFDFFILLLPERVASPQKVAFPSKSALDQHGGSSSNRLGVRILLQSAWSFENDQLPLQTIFHMLEDQSDSLVRNNKSEKFISASDRLSLPSIHDKSAHLDPHNQYSHKQKLRLPRINAKTETPLQHRNATEPEIGEGSPRAQHSGQNKSIKSTFARQMEERMRFVLDGLERSNSIELNDEYGTDGFNFEARVNANKELIRQCKEKNVAKNNPQPAVSRRPPVPPQSANKALQRKKSLREKPFRDPSIGKDSKRKGSVRERGTPSKKKLSLKKLGKNLKIEEQGVKNIRGKSNRTRSQNTDHFEKVSKREEARINKLFDGIQNYLSNPTPGKSPLQNPVIGLSLLKAKRELEDKIKALNDKLGIEGKDQQSPSTTYQSNEEDGVRTESIEREWRRKQVTGRKVVEVETDLDNEIKRLARLQDKNELALGGFMDNQKWLLQLELTRKLKELSPKLNQ